jgi:hypothetical protein
MLPFLTRFIRQQEKTFALFLTNAIRKDSCSLSAWVAELTRSCQFGSCCGEQIGTPHC